MRSAHLSRVSAALVGITLMAAAGGLSSIAHAQWTNSGGNAVLQNPIGRVGVGTNPNHPLHLYTNSLYGGYFQNVGDSSAAVFGYGAAINGDVKGVWGYSEAPFGTGVLGQAVSGSGSAVGVRGHSLAPGGFGGYFEGGRFGIFSTHVQPGGYAAFLEGTTYVSANLGVGTINPLAKLHVYGFASPAELRLQSNAGAGNPVVSFVHPTNPFPYVGMDFDDISDALRIRTNVGAFALNTTAMAVRRTTGNVGIGRSDPSAKLHIAGGVKIDSTNSLEFGAGIAGKEMNAGRMGYGLFTNNTLDIVGGGTTGLNRQIKLWAEGGTTFTGRVFLPNAEQIVFNGRGHVQANELLYLNPFAGASTTIVGGGGSANNDLLVSGSLSKAGGSFMIDHPLDPENKYLYHSFVESPDMMNIYNGNIVTDERGYATITLPDYFDALNRDFRYQLTVIDENAPDAHFVRVSSKIGVTGQNEFVIKSVPGNLEVSWTVTGIRKDAWAEKNRIPNAVEKTGEEKGKYLHPDAFGKTVEMGVHYRRAHESAPAANAANPSRE